MPPHPSAAAPTASSTSGRRAVIASLVGTTIEWFDFFIYGLAATLVFADLFFPTGDPHTARLASFATIGVAFIARPIGAALFGHLGDRWGRRPTLIATLTLMGLATGLIGVLPTYASIGIWAPVLLILLRLLQGLAVGGEWGGAVLMSVEHAPPARRRLYGSAPQMGSPLGLVLATAVMSAVAGLPDDQLASWGWRIPFLAGFLLVIVGLLIRLGVEEPASFAALKQREDTVRLPIKEVFTRSWRGLLTGIGLQASVNVVFYMISVYFLSYATKALGMPRSTALLIIMIAAAVDLLALPFLAALCDRIGPHRVFITGLVFTMAAAFPFFLLVTGESVALTTIVVTAMLVGAHATTYAVVSSLVADRFTTRVRYSGTALSNALAGLLFSAPTPFFAEAVGGATGTRWWPLALAVIATSVISLIAILTVPREIHGTAARTAEPMSDRTPTEDLVQS